VTETQETRNAEPRSAAMYPLAGHFAGPAWVVECRHHQPQQEKETAMSTQDNLQAAFAGESPVIALTAHAATEGKRMKPLQGVRWLAGLGLLLACVPELPTI
jgi:hypothetical protein